MTREERILVEIVKRLQRITIANGFATNAGLQVAVDPEDSHADADAGDAIAVLPGDALPVDTNRNANRVQLPVAIQAFTQSRPELPADASALERAAAARKAGYVLWRDVMRALFPSAASYADDLAGAASTFTYAGHGIYPRGEGEKTTSIFVDTTVEYVLHTNDPDK